MVLIGWVTTYNGLVARDHDVQSRWADVANAYQSRADLVGIVVSTVKGPAALERDAMHEVAVGWARVGQAAGAVRQRITEDSASFTDYQQAQDALTLSLSHLMVGAERYPDGHASQNLRNLRSQLATSENRIADACIRFNEAAQAFNIQRENFPDALRETFLGSRLAEKTYLSAPSGEQPLLSAELETR